MGGLRSRSRRSSCRNGRQDTALAIGKATFGLDLRTEKSRLRRSRMRLQEQMRRMRHLSIQEQTDTLNQMLRGHYAYYGIVGSIRALQRVRQSPSDERVGAEARPTALAYPVGTGQLLSLPRSTIDRFLH